MFLAVLVSGCGIKLQGSSFKVKMQEFLEAPKVVDCKLSGVPSKCVVVAERDHLWMIRELKAACLALNGSREECWVEK